MDLRHSVEKIFQLLTSKYCFNRQSGSYVTIPGQETNNKDYFAIYRRCSTFV